MSKNLRFTGLAMVGALLLAGSVLWNLDSGPPATERQNADFSGGPSASGRGRLSPPLTVQPEVREDPSPSLRIGDITEPPPGFQAVQPEPPERLAAATKRGLAPDRQLDSMITALMSREGEGSPKGNREASFDVGSIDENSSGRRATVHHGESKTDVTSPPVAAAQLDSDSEKDGGNVNPDQDLKIAARPSTEITLETGGHDIGKALREDDAGAVHSGTGESGAIEAPWQRDAPDRNTPQAVSPQAIAYTEKLLDLLGYAPGPIDDKIEPETERAILAFQKDNGGETTGKIDDQLVAALENRLFRFLQQYLKAEGWHGSEIPSMTKADQAIEKVETAKASSGHRPTEKSLANDDRYGPAKKAQSTPPTSESPPLEVRANKPAAWREIQNVAIHNQQVRLQPRSEMVAKKVEEIVPNAFEACATSGQQKEYVKTETGFVPCEEFSFDARAAR